MKFVEAAGVSAHVEMWGPTSGAPLLLIHGAFSHIGTWEPTIVPMLKNEFLLAAYDRPGMGFTKERPAGADTLAKQAAVAAGVIEQLGLRGQWWWRIRGAGRWRCAWRLIGRT